MLVEVKQDMTNIIENLLELYWKNKQTKKVQNGKLSEESHFLPFLAKTFFFLQQLHERRMKSLAHTLPSL